MSEHLRREADFWRRAVVRWDVTGKGSPAVGVLGWRTARGQAQGTGLLGEDCLVERHRRNLLMTASIGKPVPSRA